ncbi:hypothetical protein O6H91_06G100400 [Diphasiastrum complanatum]|uniref:Uncharacterized protein n=1 Tax=Diphasiastrum complanatum TaxID=34168 RepID=A0ACC2DGR0_DIPCM|nr:hypothetical protein O6H91_06G100400 [Diphasiastrum complanatum]
MLSKMKLPTSVGSNLQIPMVMAVLQDLMLLIFFLCLSFPDQSLKSSFNDKPTSIKALGPIGKELFETEQNDLLTDLKDIPRKINEFVKRARAAKIHACIIGHLKREIPSMMGKAKTQQKLIDSLEEAFGKVQREHHLPPGDLPDIEGFRERLIGYNLDKFDKLKPKMIQAVDDMLGRDIPGLLQKFRNPYD